MARSQVRAPAPVRRALRMGLRGPRDPVSTAGRRHRAAEQSLGERYARQVLDLTNRLAEVMLSSGSGAADVVATAQDVAHAYRLTDCVVEITFTTIIVSALPAPDAPQVTLVRSVRSRSTDYTRLSELDALIRKITSGGVSVDEAHQEMDALTERSHPYPRWVSTAAWAGFAFGIAMLLQGTWQTGVLAALTTALVDRFGRVLNRAKTPFFFQQVAGAGVATGVAVLAWTFLDQHWEIVSLGPSILVGTGIVVLLSGMALVGSVQDALTGYMVTATARLGDVLFLTAGIVVGILGVLQLSSGAGIHVGINVKMTTIYTPSDPVVITISILGAALAAACFTLACYAPIGATGVAGGVGGLAEGLVIALNHAGFGQVVSTGLAAVAVGIAATMVSIRRRFPALVIATAGITPMLPGLAVFRAVFAFAPNGHFDQGIGLMLAAAATAVALGGGVVLGEFVGSPLRSGAGRLGRWLRLGGVAGMPGLRRAVGRDVDLQPAVPESAAPPRPTQSTSSVALVSPEDQASEDATADEDSTPPTDDSAPQTQERDLEEAGEDSAEPATDGDQRPDNP